MFEITLIATDDNATGVADLPQLDTDGLDIAFEGRHHQQIDVEAQISDPQFHVAGLGIRTFFAGRKGHHTALIATLASGPSRDPVVPENPDSPRQQALRQSWEHLMTDLFGGQSLPFSSEALLLPRGFRAGPEIAAASARHRGRSPPW